MASQLWLVLDWKHAANVCWMALAMVVPDELSLPEELADAEAEPDEKQSLRALECSRKTRSLAWAVLAAAASSRASRHVTALVGAMLVDRVGRS